MGLLQPLLHPVQTPSLLEYKGTKVTEDYSTHAVNILYHKKLFMTSLQEHSNKITSNMLVIFLIKYQSEKTIDTQDNIKTRLDCAGIGIGILSSHLGQA